MTGDLQVVEQVSASSEVGSIACIAWGFAGFSAVFARSGVEDLQVFRGSTRSDEDRQLSRLRGCA